MPETESIKRAWDGFIRVPGGLTCAICGKILGSIDNPRSNPAESYAGTYTGLCYWCERSTTWACYRCEDGLIYYSHPPHCPSWRRDREFYCAYEDCDCRNGAVRVSRSDANMGGSYNKQCEKCRDRSYAHPIRAAHHAQYEAFMERHRQVMDRLEKEYAKKKKKLSDEGAEALKETLRAEYEQWRLNNPAPASPARYYWNYAVEKGKAVYGTSGY